MWSKLGRRLTEEEFDLKLSVEYPDIKRVGVYINSKTAIEFSCKKCGRIWNKKPKEIKKINCSCGLKESVYIDKISKMGLILLDNYYSMRSNLKHRCLSCDLEFITTPKSILNSKFGCTNCSGKRFTIEKYKSLLPKNIKFLEDEYSGTKNKYKHFCLDCKTEFISKPNYIIHMGTNCPNCSKSKGERIIDDFLKSRGVCYKSQYVVDILDKKLRFDFYIELISTFIEYDGVQHFEPVDIFCGIDYFNRLKINDQLKDDWCNKSGFKLIRITYYYNVMEYLDFIWKELK
jgi:DNA-directed RNA polymerase subunit RPC12/RpoP